MKRLLAGLRMWCILFAALALLCVVEVVDRLRGARREVADPHEYDEYDWLD